MRMPLEAYSRAALLVRPITPCLAASLERTQPVRILCYGERIGSAQTTGPRMSQRSTAAFFDVWHTYRKVVAANYMHHMEIRAQLERVLLAQFASRPFSFLDLGCGDAASLAPLGLTHRRHCISEVCDTTTKSTRRRRRCTIWRILS
jgi:hypothetical protein